jgi:CRP-like cAMP-binding protein
LLADAIPDIAMAIALRPQDNLNHLLAHLPLRDYRLLAANLQPVPITSQQCLWEAEAPLEQVYFPTTAVCALLAVLGSKQDFEVTTVGNEGLVGLEMALGLEHSLHRAIGLVAGECLGVPARALQQAVRRSARLDTVLRHYAGYAWRAATQALACFTLHALEARLARTLLATSDRAGSEELPLTQEQLAALLGVRRQQVSLAAGALQAAGAIAYHRGVIRILNRTGLERASCLCYAAMKRLYEANIEQ